MTITEFRISFWSIAQVSKFEEQVRSLIESCLIEDWTGSDMSNTRGHSPEVHCFFDVKEDNLSKFEKLTSKLQGVYIRKDDEVIVEAIAPKDREQHREWCNLFEEEYTELFGTPEEEEENEKHLNETLAIWFRQKPIPKLFVEN